MSLPKITPPPEPLEINGRKYPLWSQFVHRANEWVGKKLQDLGDPDLGPGSGGLTEITGIVLRANGDDSAWFEVTGKDFSCGFDVHYGGVVGGEEGWLTFVGYGGHSWRIESLGIGPKRNPDA